MPRRSLLHFRHQPLAAKNVPFLVRNILVASVLAMMPWFLSAATPVLAPQAASPVPAQASADDIVVVAGFNGQGQLGLSQNPQLIAPEVVASGVTDVVAAPLWAVYITKDSTLWGMGFNSHGQLGPVQGLVPTPIPLLSNVKAAAAGTDHLLILTHEGKLLGLGDNSHSELAQSGLAFSSPVQIASEVIAIAAGSSFSLFLKKDGTLWGMGANTLGELGDGSGVVKSTPVLLANDVAQVAAAGSSSFIIKKDGSLWASGKNTDGQLGLGTSTQVNAFTQVSSAVAFVSPGTRNTFFIRTDGVLMGMGFNHIGQLGNGGSTTQLSPITVAADVTHVSHSYLHTVYVDKAARVWGAGANFSGELGLGNASTPSGSMPRQGRFDLNGTRKVAAVDDGTLFLGKDGVLRAAGDTTGGSLGVERVRSITAPARIGSGIKEFSVGFEHCLILGEDGTLLGQGANELGQLATSGYLFQSTRVTLATGVKAVAAGHSMTAFIKTDGTLWAVGHNTYGQLNTGNTYSTYVPRLVDSGVKKVFKTNYNTLYLKEDNTLWGLGRNSYGTLNGTGTSAQMSPLQLASDVSIAAAGNDHLLYLKTDGSLWAVGSNQYGQLGLGSLVHNTAPTQIATNVISLAVGDQHSVFLKADGSAWTMGRNQYGQLGTSGSYLSTPRQLASAVSSVAAGGNCTAYLRTDGTAWLLGTTLKGLYDASATAVQVGSDVTGIEVGTNTLLLRLKSTAAVIASNVAPTITDISDQFTVQGRATEPASFTVGDANGGAASLIVTARSSNAVLVPDTQILLGNRGTTRTVCVLPTPGLEGVATITVTVSDGQASASDSFVLTVNKVPALANISARAKVADKDNLLVPGFVLSGPAGTRKRMLIRAVGARLADFGLPLGELLTDPTLTLFRTDLEAVQQVAVNDDWTDAANYEDINKSCHAVGAFALKAAASGGTDDTRSSALLVDLEPGSYTAECKGKGAATGIALVEVYDVSGASSQLVNVSNRGYVGSGNNVMVPGLVVDGSVSKTYLIRGVGPGLSQFGVGGVLEDPKITLHRITDGTATVVATSDNWSDLPANKSAVLAAGQTVKAFAMTSNEADSKDAALVVTLAPGLYTVTCEGVGGSSGVAIVEVYEVP